MLATSILIEPCVECDKPVRIDRTHWRIHQNTRWENVPEHYDGDDSQGTFAIGPECRRSFPHAFRAEPMESRW